jgi:hypothetical protein
MTSPTHATDYPATIPTERMNQLIAEGRAQPWTRDLHGHTPQAALLDGTRDHAAHPATLAGGTWYVVLADTDDYQQAAPELADILTRDAARLAAADQAVADVDARNRT